MDKRYREKNGRFAIEKNVNKRKKAIQAMSIARVKKRRIEHGTEENNHEDVPKNNVLLGNRIINLQVLATSLKCTSCPEILDLRKCTEEKRSGLQSTFIITCKCGKVNSVCTSESTVKNNKTYADINTVGVLGAVHSGAGHTKFDKILSCMDIPPISQKLYKKYEAHVGEAIEEAAKDSCKRAIAEEKLLVLKHVEKLYDYLPPEITEKVYPSVHKFRVCTAKYLPDSEFDTALGDFVNVIGMYDMAWTTRGTGRSYDSLNGYGAMFGYLSKKIMAYISLIRICAYCKRRGIDEGHENCRKNFVGSAKSMEAYGALTILQSSLFEEQKVRIKILVGDDDSSVISLLNKRLAYLVYKLSDRNHVIKNLKKELYVLAESHKELKKAGVIKYLEKLFGYCLSQNEGKSDELAQVLRSIPEHAFGNHESCENWCKRKENSEGQTMVLSGDALYQSLQTIFNKYANNARKFCVLASTQSNESTHNMIAHIMPKNTCLSRTASADYRVAQAVNIKNDGEASLVVIRNKLNIPATSILIQHVNRIDSSRSKRALKATTKEAKVKRLNAKKKREELRKTNESNEGITYKSNVGFDNSDAPNIPTHAGGTFLPRDHCLVYFDTETTGLFDSDIILQIGAICNDKSFSVYVTPTKNMHPDASKTTGLTVKLSHDANVEHNKLFLNGEELNTLSINDALLAFYQFLSNLKRPVILIAHNATFDAKKLIAAIVQTSLQNEFECKVLGFTDTLPILRKALPHRKGKGMFKLACLANDFLNETDKDSGNFHDALYDVQILQKLIRIFDKEKILLHCKKPFSYYIEEQANADVIAQNLPLLNAFKKSVSKEMIKRMAMNNITCESLLSALKKGGDQYVKDILCERMSNGKTRVTNHKITLNKIITSIKALNNKED